jgi:hypothetical protein
MLSCYIKRVCVSNCFWDVSNDVVGITLKIAGDFGLSSSSVFLNTRKHSILETDCGTQCRVVRMWTNVSDEHITSVFRVENPPSKRPVCRKWSVHGQGAISQKIAKFVTTAVRTSNSTWVCFCPQVTWKDACSVGSVSNIKPQSLLFQNPNPQVSILASLSLKKY